MRILRAILIASLSIPVLLFLVFFAASLVILIKEVVESGDYGRGWLGGVFGGLVYAYFALLLSTVPTIVFGLPLSLLANRYGLLKPKIIYTGAMIAGGLFLTAAAMLSFGQISIDLLLWSFGVGSIGGLFNGYVFQKVRKHGISADSVAPTRTPGS